jgi:hypothetical protein
MNRIILIGNGFDLAHGLKTSYRDFIDDFWEKKIELFQEAYNGGNVTYQYHGDISLCNYQDEDIRVTDICYHSNYKFREILEKKGYEQFNELISCIPQIALTKLIKNKIRFNNTFLELITKKQSKFNWVDIEDEYYLALVKCLEDETGEEIEHLNKGFLSIQTALEKYLKSQSAIKINASPEIEEKIYLLSYDGSPIKTPLKDTLNNFLFLNFNYTSTEKLYASPTNKVIHIHGELDNPKNPIIFGYGDEIGEKYKLIEQKNDNSYLKNVKSIKYSLTRNYSEFLNYINSDFYQVYIMGHSCGISDRTLLNVLFEHDNCLSIKVFYHKRNDGTDNHSDIVMNISRNFTKKSLMRERLIAKEDSEPLL